MGTLGLFVTNSFGTTRLLAEVTPSGPLMPLDIAKWQTPMLIPPQMPRSGTPDRGRLPHRLLRDRGAAVPQQILPAGMPPTTVWGYGPAQVAEPAGPTIFTTRRR